MGGLPNEITQRPRDRNLRGGTYPRHRLQQGDHRGDRKSASSQEREATGGAYSERRAVERVLKRLHARLQKLVGESWKSISSSQLTTDQLADLHDQIRNNEQRMTTIQEEVIALQRETVDEEDVTRALSAFNPVWESLSVREQSRIIHLLIERIGYDGGDGKVTVTFRSLGIKELCARVQPSEEEVV